MNHWTEQHAISYDEKWGELDFHRDIPKLAQVAAGDQIVEIGCGGGFLSLCLVKCAPSVQVLAVDPTAKMIELAKARQQSAEIPRQYLRFEQCGAEQLQLDPGAVGLVIAAFSIHHCADPKRVAALVFEGLKPSGRIWLCEDLNTPTDGDMAVDDSLKNYEGIKGLLENAGFTSIVASYRNSVEGDFLIVEAAKP